MPKRSVIQEIVRDKTCPERMGICEDFWPETINESWPLLGFGTDLDPVVHFDFDMVDLCEYWRGQRFCPEPIPWHHDVLEEDHETEIFRDGWGAKLRYFKQKSGTPEHIAFDMTSPEVWKKKYRERLLTLDPKRFPGLADMRRRFAHYAEAGYVTMYNNTFVFEHMRYSMGDVVMLQAFLTEPEWIHDFCSVDTEFQIQHVEYLFREVGVPDAYTIYDDMAYNKSGFISPAMYREFITPYHKKFVDFLKSYGVMVILHSCGRVDAHIENFIEAGIDCIQPLEAKTGMDLAELGAAFGDRIAFMGNIDIRALETCNRDAIAAEIRKKLDIVRRHRIPYIFHTDHSLSPAVTVDAYTFAVEQFRGNCHY